MKHRPTNRWPGSALAAAFAALALTMAGCAAPGSGDDQAENRAPNADLKASKNIGWTGESFAFDGSESSDDDGQVVEWRFDYGDGTIFVAKSKEEAKSTHTYARGGEYTVTLTVIDNGRETAGAESAKASHTVAVNERAMVPAGTVFANPVGNDDTVGVARQTFDVRKDADRIEVRLDMQSAIASGESRVEVRVLNPDGDEIARKEHTVGAQQNETFELNDIVVEDDPGQYTLEVISHSGGATFDGDIEVYYDAGYTS